jgi:hypothetical protein
MRWHGDTGWAIDIDKGMTPSEIQRCVDFTLKVQLDRWRGLLPGDRKDECWRTILDLKSNKVSVNVAGTGERVLFDAYKSNKKYWGAPYGT